MYVSIQTVCGCHGYLLFESIHCDRCRSLIPFQLTDESLIDPVITNDVNNGVHIKAIQSSKQVSNILAQYKKQQGATTGRIRFRAFCPFCNSATYVLRYYCKRERLYYHLRLQSFNESEQSIYKTIAETQHLNTVDQNNTKQDQTDSSVIESIDDSYSISGSVSQQPSTVLYDQSGIPTSRDIQIENEKHLYALNNLEGDLFNVLRNGLFYDTLIQCQDDVKIQAHRCILGGRSNWFRNLLGEYHDVNTQDDYVLQISIDDVQSDVMNEILNFMYTNRCLISLKNAPDLLIAAKRFELEKLRKQIAEFLLSRLNVENSIEMLICAHEAGSEALKLASIRLINRNAEKIKRTARWKTFKTQYVDLVPELYEDRIERPAPPQPVYLPDVFSAPAMPSDSLRTLSQLYDNPVKQRATSPTPRILLPPAKSQQTGPPPPPPFATVQHVQPTEPITQGASGTFTHRDVSTPSSIMDRGSPVKKRVISNTRRRPAPAPAAPPLTRTVFPTVRHASEMDHYRRPVNVYEKSTALPTAKEKQQTIHTQISQKPPPPATTKISRGVSPIQKMKVRRRSSTVTEIPPDDHIILARVVSAETTD